MRRAGASADGARFGVSGGGGDGVAGNVPCPPLRLLPIWIYIRCSEYMTNRESILFFGPVLSAHAFPANCRHGAPRSRLIHIPDTYPECRTSPANVPRRLFPGRVRLALLLLAIGLPHPFDHLALGEPEPLGLGHDGGADRGKDLGVKLIGARARLAARLAARAAIGEAVRLADGVDAVKILRRRALAPRLETRQPVRDVHKLPP